MRQRKRRAEQIEHLKLDVDSITCFHCRRRHAYPNENTTKRSRQVLRVQTTRGSIGGIKGENGSNGEAFTASTAANRKGHGAKTKAGRWWTLKLQRRNTNSRRSKR